MKLVAVNLVIVVSNSYTPYLINYSPSFSSPRVIQCPRVLVTLANFLRVCLKDILAYRSLKLFLVMEDQCLILFLWFCFGTSIRRRKKED